MKMLILTNSDLDIFVDDENYIKLFLLGPWCLSHKDGYASQTKSPNKKLHKILGDMLGIKNVDHADRNKLNNQKENLRESTKSQNTANILKRIGNYTSAYKGVCWHVKTNKWRSRIMVNYSEIHLGLFLNELDAAKAYNQAAIKYFGKFAALNVI